MNEQTLDVSSSEAPPPPPPPSHWYDRPIARDHDHKKVGGVISGLCRTYGFDVRTTRVAVAVATIFMPVLIAVYALAWLALPLAPQPPASLREIARDRRRLPLYIVIAIVIVAGGLGSIGSWYFLGNVPWGIGLIAVGVLLWVAATGRRTPPVPPSPPPPFVAGPAPAPSTLESPGTPRSTVEIPIVPSGPEGTVPLLPGLAPAHAAEPSTPSRRRSPVMLITVLATMAFVGIARAGQGIGWWHLSILATVIASALMLATGAVVSSVVHTSWARVPLAVFMATIATFLLIAKPHLDGGVGERSVRPTSVEQAQTLTVLGIGALTVDLRGMPVGGETVVVTAKVGIGRLHVIAPPDAALDLDVSVGAGHAVVDHVEIESGLRNDQHRTVPAFTESHRTIRLILEIGMGEIAVDHGQG